MDTYDRQTYNFKTNDLNSSSSILNIKTMYIKEKNWDSYIYVYGFIKRKRANRKLEKSKKKILRGSSER